MNRLKQTISGMLATSDFRGIRRFCGKLGSGEIIQIIFKAQKFEGHAVPGDSFTLLRE